MKTPILFLFIFFTTFFTTSAQCVRQDALEAIDDPAQYPVTGTALLEFNLDGTKRVIFAEDFETVQGLELRVFLATTPRLNQGGTELEVTTGPLQDDNGGQDMGDTISGLKTFEITSDIGIHDFEYIIIQCVQADVLWGRALLGEAQGADCATLSIEDTTLTNTSLYPNPATSILHINTVQELSEISIFDLSGKRVFFQKGSNDIHLDGFTAGMYLVQLREQERNQTIKLIII